RLKTLDDLLQPGQALLDASYGIGRESAPRRLGGPIHINLRAQADLREGLFRRRIDYSQLCRRRRIDPGAVDVEFQFFHDFPSTTLRRATVCGAFLEVPAFIDRHYD